MASGLKTPDWMYNTRARPVTEKSPLSFEQLTRGSLGKCDDALHRPFFLSNDPLLLDDGDVRRYRSPLIQFRERYPGRAIFGGHAGCSHARLVPSPRFQNHDLMCHLSHCIRGLLQNSSVSDPRVAPSWVGSLAPGLVGLRMMPSRPIRTGRGGNRRTVEASVTMVNGRRIQSLQVACQEPPPPPNPKTMSDRPEHRKKHTVALYDRCEVILAYVIISNSVLSSCDPRKALPGISPRPTARVTADYDPSA